MKFYHPQIQLVREMVLQSPDAYYVHVVTFCPHTYFQADGYEIIGFGPNDETMTDGIYKVAVKLIQDTTLPDFDYITPVVHTIDLGSINFPGGRGVVQVQVVATVLESRGTARRDTDPPTTTTKTGGTGTVSTSDADDKSRPFDRTRL